jgi:hypothetical protein
MMGFYMMMNSKLELSSKKMILSMGALRKKTTPTLPDVVRIALVRFRWEADTKAND